MTITVIRQSRIGGGSNHGWNTFMTCAPGRRDKDGGTFAVCSLM